ncbi:hypothetical protein [Nocardioides panaciterrulae]|uniref:Uncharacterized protein n=1 Tax=Nocardioides panaciterrulae TaxID=661492 RepID=A0A7Y9E6W4_9ACTN|nr:hypothetical protein [Nocardioides panaciterrulae]NYD42258.1 hypothetical protein [Nocardioides panaciterrulae]
MTTTIARRLAATLVGLAGLASVATATYAAAPADGSSPATTTAAAERPGHRTALTLEMPGCGGCVVQLLQGTGAGTDHPGAWESRRKTVEGGTVTWRVPSRRTWGMSIIVRAPWEGRTGYLTAVAMRYGGELVGDHVSFREARSKHRAAACWEGTRSDAVTLPVVVRKVRVQGQIHRVPGSIAYLPTTTSWLAPMFPARHGVLGTQEVPTCR